MWWNDYIGLPYLEGGRDDGGLDCWGLIRKVYMDQLNLELPRLDGVKYCRDFDARSMIKAIKEATTSVVGEQFNTLTFNDEYGMYDILWLRNGGPIHFGVFISDKKFLHIEDGCDSVIESIHSPRWKNRIRGVFRHNSRI